VNVVQKVDIDSVPESNIKNNVEAVIDRVDTMEIIM
jgi:hypothetical protein